MPHAIRAAPGYSTHVDVAAGGAADGAAGGAADGAADGAAAAVASAAAAVDGVTAAALAALDVEARALLAQPAPRATGKPCALRCGGATISCSVTTYPLDEDTPGRAPGRAAPPPRPPPVESLCDALAPLGPSGLVTVLSGLLLEQRLVLYSTRASRLVPAAWALNALLFPLRWCNTFAPLLPRSHEAVTAAPFPYILGIPLRAALQRTTGSGAGNGATAAAAPAAPTAAAAAAAADSAAAAEADIVDPAEGGGRGVLRLYLDDGRVAGEPLVAMPEVLAAPLRQRLRAALGDSNKGRAGSDSALQAACLALTATLLYTLLSRNGVTNEKSEEPLLAALLGSSNPSSTPQDYAALDALDEALRQLRAEYVRRQPTTSRAFCRQLSETAAFKVFLDEAYACAASHPLLEPSAASLLDSSSTRHRLE